MSSFFLFFLEFKTGAGILLFSFRDAFLLLLMTEVVCSPSLSPLSFNRQERRTFTRLLIASWSCPKVDERFHAPAKEKNEEHFRLAEVNEHLSLFTTEHQPADLFCSSVQRSLFVSCWCCHHCIGMAKHHPDLIMCRKQPGVGECATVFSALCV